MPLIRLKKIVNCAIKQSGKVPHKVFYRAFEYIHIENALYKCNSITISFQVQEQETSAWIRACHSVSTSP